MTVQYHKKGFYCGADFDSRVTKDLAEFKKAANVIIANRYTDDLEDVLGKVYSRDLYFRD